MKFLIDTHVFIWFALDNKCLSAKAHDLIADGNNIILISPMSYWELAIKISLGKYKLEMDFATFFTNQLIHNDFTILPIEIKHAATLANLPFHHRDPFDRMLIAQAITEDLPLISKDEVFCSYPLKVIW